MSKISGWFVLLGSAWFLAACAGSQAPSSEAAAQAPSTPVQAPAPTPSTQAAAKPADESLTIDFNTAGTTLSPQAKSQLDGAARLYRDAQPEVMIISGHSDKSGEEFANLILSARRADIVKKALVDRGIPAERLQIVAVGEAELVPTAPPSRTAVVTWR